MASSDSIAVTEITATNSKFRVLTASLVGTTIEFFDFYIYATAAVIIFPYLFFPTSTDPMTATIQSLATCDCLYCPSNRCCTLWSLRRPDRT